MSTDPADGMPRTLSPGAAFSVLGNETRIDILRALGRSDEALSFTELRNRVGFRQGEQFNYHLDKLIGHFVEKREEGYALREPGHRVIQAVVSGAVTGDPMVEPTTVDWWECPFCGGEVVVEYAQEQLGRYCTECDGLYGDVRIPPTPFERDTYGSLQALHLPPAGVLRRTADDALKTAFIWGYAEWLVAAHDVCPRCSAVVERSIDVCADHDPGQTFCDDCGEQHAIQFETRCTNCRFALSSIASMHLVGAVEVLDFITDHGVNAISDPWDWGWEYEEDVLSTDPLRARITFEIDDEALTLTVDEELSVLDATRKDVADAV